MALGPPTGSWGCDTKSWNAALMLRAVPQRSTCIKPVGRLWSIPNMRCVQSTDSVY